MSSVAGSGRAGIEERTRDVLTAWAAEPDRVVLFDFNGTLSDDEPLLLAVYSDMLLEHLDWPLTSEYYFEHLAGRSDREIIIAALEAVRGKDSPMDAAQVALLLAERHTRYAALVERRSPIRPETLESVSCLLDLGVPLGIVTGAPRADVVVVLAQCGLGDAFSVIVAEEDVIEGKPHPAGFLSAIAALDRPARAALVFEDSLPGVQAAKSAGMRCIGVEGTCDRAALLQVADAAVPLIVPELFVLS